MKYLLPLFLFFQTLVANSQEIDTMLFRQLEANLQKAGDSMVYEGGFILWENCSCWGGNWPDCYEYDKKGEAFVMFLKKHPNVKIELARHTGCRGRAEFNLSFSQKIANVVKEYLVERGIVEDRIVAKGYGETQPVVPCADCLKCEEEVHWKNSRFVVRVLE